MQNCLKDSRKRSRRSNLVILSSVFQASSSHRLLGLRRGGLKYLWKRERANEPIPLNAASNATHTGSEPSTLIKMFLVKSILLLKFSSSIVFP